MYTNISGKIGGCRGEFNLQIGACACDLISPCAPVRMHGRSMHAQCCKCRIRTRMLPTPKNYGAWLYIYICMWSRSMLRMHQAAESKCFLSNKSILILAYFPQTLTVVWDLSPSTRTGRGNITAHQHELLKLVGISTSMVYLPFGVVFFPPFFFYDRNGGMYSINNARGYELIVPMVRHAFRMQTCKFKQLLQQVAGCPSPH